MGGLMGGGGGGGGGGNSGAGDAFASSGGGFTGASTDLYPNQPNAYDYGGGGQGGAPNDYAYSGQTLEDASAAGGQMGNQNPAQALEQAPQQIQAGSIQAPPATTAPGGQQSAAPPSLFDMVSNTLLGKGASDIVGASQAGATSGGGGPPMPTAPANQAGPGWLKQEAQQPPQTPTNLTGTTFFDPRQTQRPNPPAPATPAQAPGVAGAAPQLASVQPAAQPPAANTPDQLPLPPMPFPTETQTADATVSPQSPPASGDKTAKSAPGATAPAAAPAAPAAAAPDLMGSSRESGMGPATPGYYDPRTGAGQAQQGVGSKGNALGDLLHGNLGMFLSDLFGGGAAPGGQPSYAASQPDASQPSTADASTPNEPPPGPIPNAAQAPPFRVANTPTGIPNPQGARAYPQIADVGQLLKPQAQTPAATTAPSAPATAAAPQAPQAAGAAGAALPPAATAGMTPEQRMAIAKPQANPDGSVTPTNGMPGGTVPSAPPAAPGFGALPNQANRPRQYTGTLTMPDGQKFRYGTGGGQFASLPYGTYHLNPGAIGSTGRRIGAWSGIGDSGSGNTVNDPLYRGGGGTHARAGVEIHPDVSGGRLVTNGCIGIDRNQARAFGQDFKAAAAKGPMILTVRPDGSASISYANSGPRWANAIPSGPGGPVSAGPTTRGDRNMNPGNIKMGPDARQFGATGVDNQGHAIFPSVEAGIQAQASLLRRNYNNKTVPEMGRSYAGDRNWAKGVMAAGGFRPNERLNLNDPATMSRLQQAIWKQEGTHPQVATAQHGAQAFGLNPGGPVATPGGTPLATPTSSEPQASSTTYEDELRKRAEQNAGEAAGTIAKYAPVGRVLAPLRGAMSRFPGEPGGIGKDFEKRRRSLAEQAGVSDIERLLYGWGGPSQ